MPPPIPPVIVPYLQECLSTPSQILVTSVLDAPATWLVLRFLAAVLLGVDDEDRKTQASESGRSTVSGQTVTFISFVHSFEMWADIGKKMVYRCPNISSYSSAFWLKPVGNWSFIFDYFKTSCLYWWASVWCFRHVCKSPQHNYIEITRASRYYQRYCYSQAKVDFSNGLKQEGCHCHRRHRLHHCISAGRLFATNYSVPYKFARSVFSCRIESVSGLGSST